MRNLSNKFSRSEYKPENPEKYIGTYPIICRSSWERVFCNTADKHPNILKWASESIKIPYRNPLTGKATIYIPDFLISYIDRSGNMHLEVVEIKPLNQTVMEKARGQRNKIAVAINTAKWIAARKWCKKHQMTFRILTELDLFAQLGNAPKRKKRRK